jgi:hypothetical protein
MWRVTNTSRDGEKCFCDDRMLLGQRVESVTHVVELLNFVQNRGSLLVLSSESLNLGVISSGAGQPAI